jgi:thiol peroxidase
MATERKGAITLKGNPKTLVGPELKPGDKAPEATLTGQDLSEVKLLAGSKGKVRLLNVVLSLDTGICDAQTRRFDKEAASMPNVAAYTISMDLPFNQKRFCGGADIKHPTLSDHKTGEFGEKYGILIKELRMHGRAVFVVGSDDKVAYAGYNKEIAEPPDYDKALAALKAAK